MRGASSAEWRQRSCLALVVGPLLVGAALERRVDGPNRSLRTSSSAEPVPEGRLVRLSHRHLRVRACVAEADGDRKLCKPELIDADSAATPSFWLDAAPSSVDDEERRASATFAHQVGLQEQVIELSPGRWRVTWEEAGVVRRLPGRSESARRGTLDHFRSLRASSRRVPSRAGASRSSGQRSRRREVRALVATPDDHRQRGRRGHGGGNRAWWS